MNIPRIKNAINFRAHRFINQNRGWKTDRKIVIIESDDWGGIRMPDRETYEKCLKTGIRVNNSHYNKYDTLASNEDFEHLYNTLSKHKDRKNHSPVITANTIVANPDFDKIKNSNFEEYYYESFTETMKRYKNRSFSSWKEGIDNGLFYPQLHGREHLNIERWLRHLKNPSKELTFAFENNLIGLGPSITNDSNPSFVQAFDQDFYLESQPLNKILIDACELFEKIFGYNSKSFIAPNYIWNDEVEKQLSTLGIEYFQGNNYHKKSEKLIYHYLGQRNIHKQIYLIRNVIYEPSSDKNKNWNELALKQIETAFKFNNPAVICMHRVNFIGSIFEENRNKNLKLLDQLLVDMLKCWPEIEFMNSVNLGELIKNEISPL